ncbi:hypothetical protein MTR67_026359, partial [Solanum verrucosum]
MQAKDRQTRKYYATYNTLLGIKELMLKETSLLNSIHSQVLHLSISSHTCLQGSFSTMLALSSCVSVLSPLFSTIFGLMLGLFFHDKHLPESPSTVLGMPMKLRTSSSTSTSTLRPWGARRSKEGSNCCHVFARGYQALVGRSLLLTWSCRSEGWIILSRQCKLLSALWIIRWNPGGTISYNLQNYTGDQPSRGGLNRGGGDPVQITLKTLIRTTPLSVKDAYERRGHRIRGLIWTATQQYLLWLVRPPHIVLSSLQMRLPWPSHCPNFQSHDTGSLSGHPVHHQQDPLHIQVSDSSTYRISYGLSIYFTKTFAELGHLKDGVLSSVGVGMAMGRGRMRGETFSAIIDHFNDLEAGKDTLWWKWRKNLFKVSNAYNWMNPSTQSSNDWPWKVLTQDNLMKRGIPLCPRCFFCGETAETVNYLFLHCKITGQLRRIFLNLKGICISCTLPGKITEANQSWDEE